MWAVTSESYTKTQKTENSRDPLKCSLLCFTFLKTAFIYSCKTLSLLFPLGKEKQHKVFKKNIRIFSPSLFKKHALRPSILTKCIQWTGNTASMKLTLYNAKKKEKKKKQRYKI